MLAFAGSQTKSDIFFFCAPVILGRVKFQVLAGLKLPAVFPDEHLPAVGFCFQVFHSLWRMSGG
jgi:hypothetical protein